MPSATAALLNSTLAYLAASSLYANASAPERAAAAAAIRRDLSCTGTARRLPTSEAWTSAMRGGSAAEFEAITGGPMPRMGFWHKHCARNYNRKTLQILCAFEAKWWCVSTAAVMHVKSCGGVFCSSKVPFILGKGRRGSSARDVLRAAKRDALRAKRSRQARAS